MEKRYIWFSSLIFTESIVYRYQTIFCLLPFANAMLYVLYNAPKKPDDLILLFNDVVE